MLIRKSDAPTRTVYALHDGHGPVHGTVYLGDYARAEGGFKLIHESVLDPGSRIGTHGHTTDEEIYVVLSGTGEMTIDGTVERVEAGDVCLTRGGHSHGLTNTGAEPMRVLVVGVNPSPRPEREANA